MPEPSFKLRQILFKKTWMFSWTFGVCFFHLNTVSKNLGEELKTINAGNFIRYFKIQTFWFTGIELVMECPVAPRAQTFLSASNLHDASVLLFTHDIWVSNRIFKFFVFQIYNTKYLWEHLEKMYNLKNVIYKGSCLPARVLLPRNFLIFLILSWGKCWALENDC